MNADACYQAARSKDPRFDGVFYSAVTSTGIYCRPSCPAVTPKRTNMRFYPTSAAAQHAGFRSCKRCRPDSAPGSPEWNVRADVVSRSMRLINDGVVDRVGVRGLVAQVGYSERHLTRQLVDEVGASPLALARAQRARTARMLLETTDLPVSDVAFAAGFASIRQFNDTVKAVFAATPTQLRASGRGSDHPLIGDAALGDAVATGQLRVRLPYREPLDLDGLLGFLGRRVVPGTEEFINGSYRRSVALRHGDAVVTLSAGPAGGNYVVCDLQLDDLRDLTTAVQRCRRMLDLDCDPIAIDHDLRSDVVIGPLVAADPGRRVPGTIDPVELAVRVVIGQQVSVVGARTIAGRLVAKYGRPLARPVGSVTHTFPSADALAAANPADLPMPVSRKRAIHQLTLALADGSVSLDQGADWDEAAATLISLHGIGPWTVAAIRMRALGDPDVCLSTDLGIKHAVENLGFPGSPATIDAMAEQWKPWRSYATQHLWASLDSKESKK